MAELRNLSIASRSRAEEGQPREADGGCNVGARWLRVGRAASVMPDVVRKRCCPTRYADLDSGQAS